MKVAGSYGAMAAQWVTTRLLPVIICISIWVWPPAEIICPMPTVAGVSGAVNWMRT